MAGGVGTALFSRYWVSFLTRMSGGYTGTAGGSDTHTPDVCVTLGSALPSLSPSSEAGHFDLGGDTSGGASGVTGPFPEGEPQNSFHALPVPTRPPIPVTAGVMKWVCSWPGE